jgi:hypothetical protein
MRKTLSECQQCIESWSLMATEKFLLSPDRPPVELWPWCASSVISPLYNICILRCAVKSRCHNRRPSMDGADPIGGHIIVVVVDDLLIPPYTKDVINSYRHDLDVTQIQWIGESDFDLQANHFTAVCILDVHFATKSLLVTRCSILPAVYSISYNSWENLSKCADNLNSSFKMTNFV